MFKNESDTNNARNYPFTNPQYFEQQILYHAFVPNVSPFFMNRQHGTTCFYYLIVILPRVLFDNLALIF